MLDLDKLEKLYAEATKGEWTHTPDDGSGYGDKIQPDIACSWVGGGGINGSDNAALIVALHNAFPALLDELRALREVEAEVRGELEPDGVFTPEAGVVDALSRLDALRAGQGKEGA